MVAAWNGRVALLSKTTKDPKFEVGSGIEALTPQALSVYQHINKVTVDITVTIEKDNHHTEVKVINKGATDSNEIVSFIIILKLSNNVLQYRR